MCIAMIILAIIIDVAVYKWRKLTSLILYFELVYTILVALVPSSENPPTMIYWYMMTIFHFIGYFTDSGTQVVVTSISITVKMLPVGYFIYDTEVTAVSVGMALMIAIIVFFTILTMTFVMLYISELHFKMKTMNIENAKLLDGMHEGVLILSK